MQTWVSWLLYLQTCRLTVINPEAYWKHIFRLHTTYWVRICFSSSPGGSSLYLGVALTSSGTEGPIQPWNICLGGVLFLLGHKTPQSESNWPSIPTVKGHIVARGPSGSCSLAIERSQNVYRPPRAQSVDVSSAWTGVCLGAIHCLVKKSGQHVKVSRKLLDKI
jgi:hypothetical protein